MEYLVFYGELILTFVKAAFCANQNIHGALLHAANRFVWYELQDDYYIPCLILSEEETQPIGLWGQRHKQYLKEHKHFLYTTMLIEGTLNSYLADIDKQAQERLLLLTKQIAEQENVTEQLKADNAMLWVQKMNEIQSRVREIIYNEIIYA